MKLFFHSNLCLDTTLWKNIKFFGLILNISGRESGGGGGGGGAGGAGAPPLRIAMNIHSMKLFNNLIKNTLLAPMFCGLVKS